MRYFFFLSIFIFRAYSADFTTYIGGQYPYQVSAVATDSAGNTYVTGIRDLPANSNQPWDAFVTKLDASGKVVFTTTMAGRANAITVAAAGDIWVGGDGFLSKLSLLGAVVSSSPWAGTIYGVATDSSNDLYVVGSTRSSTYPTTAGLPNDTTGLGNGFEGFATGAFVTKLDPTGTKIIYSAVIAGTQVDCSGGSTCFLTSPSAGAGAIAIDAAGDALVIGNTNTTDVGVTSGAMPGYGAFAVKINAAGTQMVYLTYLGPPNGDISILGPSQSIRANAIASDAAGDAYITGSTNDTFFPATAGAFQTTLSGDVTQSYPNSDAFVMKLNPTGAVAWGTFLGGPANDAANGIGLDSAGNVWLVGTNGTGFPTPSPGVVAAAGDFLAELSANGSKVLSEAEFASGTEAQALAIDSSGTLHVAGTVGLVWTITPDVLYAPRIFGVVNAAGSQISGRIAPGEIVSIYGTGLGPALGASATLLNGRFPTTVAGVQVLLNGAPIPLIYVSATQINAEIPAPLAAGSDDTVMLQVVNGTQMLPDFRAAVDLAIFEIFQNPDGSIAAINQDGTVNSPANPAKVGTIVAMWATGLTPAGATIDGALTPSANNWCGSCQFSIGVTTETAAYAGAAPGLIDGAMQINLLVPAQKYGQVQASQLQVFYQGQVYGFIYTAE